MDKESLIKIRDFLLEIDKKDMPPQDKLEFIRNASLFFDPEQYEENVQVMAKKFNEELRWKGKNNV